MARLAVLVTTLLLVLAPTASATTSVGWGTWDWPPIWQSWQRHIGVQGSDGVNHDIVVKPSGAQQLYGYPQRVDIYDYSDTVVPSSGGNPCHIISTHHAQCVTSGGPTNPANPYSYPSFAHVGIGTGDGNDSVQVSDPLNPMIVTLFTGAGNDHVDVSGMWGYYDAYSGGGLSLGDGNDTASVGPAAPPGFAPLGNPGFLVEGGAGDDSLTTLNTSFDQVTCDDGNDTLLADPTDENYFEPGFGPPRGNDCESRTPPAAPSP
jgi:hypothetical protein